MSGAVPSRRNTNAWPELPLREWQSSLDTLHMWLQIAGKIKLECVPFVNQWWHVTLHPTARGLTTGLIPSEHRTFEMKFDFVDHHLYLLDADGNVSAVDLAPTTVADFYTNVMGELESLGISVKINPVPVEVPHTIPFTSDTVHHDYDPEYVSRWWTIMLHTTRVMHRYRSKFSGKSSPAHFYWGSFDLNMTRHSGRTAEPPAGVPRFFQLAENEENVSCGFWPGNTSPSGATFGEPAFFSYIYPEPPGYPESAVRPEAGHFDHSAGLFILKYEDIRSSEEPETAILEFFNSTYEAAAIAANWDRQRLESNPADLVGY